MGLSETILAAMIGAIATVTTALFQIFSSIKSRSKIDLKPKRGSAMRSVLAVLALMVASAVGGFLYSELLKQRDGDELRAMRMELRELKDIATAARAPAGTSMPAHEPVETQPSAAIQVAHTQSMQRAESVAYVPACRRIAVEGEISAACSEVEAQRIALCGSIPAYARIDSIDLFAQPDAVQKPWDEHRASLEQDLGGARFTGKSFEYAQSPELKAVCVNFMQWSSEHSHIARIVVNYAFGDAPTSQHEAPPGTLSSAPTVIAAESLPALPQQASFVTSTKP
jgi:hypothetical protein